MKQKSDNSFQDWDISQGDYQRSREDTFTYQKQVRRKQLIKKSAYFIVSFFGLVVTLLLIANTFIF